MSRSGRPASQPGLQYGEDTRWLLDLAASRPRADQRRVSEADLELVLKHGLIGILAGTPHDDASAGILPVFARLQARQQIMERHLSRLLTSLHSSDIPATVVKGPHLARGAYANPSFRTFTDVDLLVPVERVEAALEVLARDPGVPSIPPKTPKADKRNIPVTDESGVNFNLDLHWDLFSYSQLRGCADGATEWAWENATPSFDHPLGPLWELPEAAMLAFLGTHAVLDHRFRLILFRDLAETARRDPDWGQLATFAERWRLRSTTYVSLLMAHRFADAPLELAYLDRLRPASLPVLAVEKLLDTTDVVRFDGHEVHPLNLAMVLLHDDFLARLRLLAAAPLAFPSWRRRVGLDRAGLSTGARSARTPRADTRRAQIGQDPPLVLHVLPVDLARGAQTYAEALSRILDEDLGRHRTMTIFRSEPVALHADIELGTRQGLARRLGFDLAAARRLWQSLRMLQPSVVVAHGGESLKYAALTAPAHVKLVYYKIGTSKAQLSFLPRRLVYRFFVRRCDVVAGVSHEMVSEARDMLGAGPESAVYAPNGRDPAPYRAWRGSSSSTVRAAFVGHLTRTKRPEVFIETIREVSDRGDRVEGVLVGDGPMLAEMEARASDAEVEVMGRREDVPEILSTCDLFIFTSLEEGEGMPGVLIEASLAGLPIVTTDVPGAGTVVEDGVTGYIVGVDDRGAMADAVHRLVADPELRRRMGDAARARALAQFTLDVSVDEWRTLLGGLLDEVNSSARS